MKHYRVLKPFKGYIKGQTHVHNTPLTFHMADRTYLQRAGFIEEIPEPGADTVEVMVEEPAAEYAVTRVGRPRGRPRGSKDQQPRKRRGESG